MIEYARTSGSICLHVTQKYMFLKIWDIRGTLIYENVLNQKFNEIAPVALFRAQT